MKTGDCVMCHHGQDGWCVGDGDCAEYGRIVNSPKCGDCWHKLDSWCIGDGDCDKYCRQLEAYEKENVEYFKNHPEEVDLDGDWENFGVDV